jgi:hypothetical protein
VTNGVKVLVALIGTCFILGCAASNLEIKEGMDPWLGQPVDNLIMKWGAPSGTYKTPGGNTVYTWVYQGGSQVVVTRIPYTSVYTANQNTSYCRFDWFTDANGIIINYRHEGQCVVKH